MNVDALVSPDVKARIIAACESIYTDLGRADKMPTTHQVRTKANCNMNSVSAVLAEWKRLLTAKPIHLPVEVPETVRGAHLEAVQIVWSAAQEQANGNLMLAEAKWAEERADFETLRAELADGFDEATAGAEQAKEELSVARRTNEALTLQIRELQGQVGDLRESLANRTATLQESENRISDLKEELNVAHLANADLREELTTSRMHAQTELNEHKSAAQQETARLSEALASSRARHEDAVDALDERSKALVEVQGLLAQAEAKSAASVDELARARATLADRQQQFDALQQRAATLEAEHSSLERSHAMTVKNLEAAQTLAETSSREAAMLTGTLQEVQRQNLELLSRVAPPKKVRQSPGKQG